ncbi:glycerophosphodiester phosphodiesterase, partial [Faecalibaculum rodentium]
SRTVQRSPAAAVLGVAVSIVICLSVAWPDRPLMDRDAGIKPVVVAHRGYAHGVTENTLESFRAAREAGAGVAELDVYQSADGSLYVSHDQSLERVTGTALDLEQALAQEIKALRTKDGQAVPALKDVLTYAKESDLHLVIEIKSTSRAVDTARKTAELIREMGMGEQCSIAGFRHSVLAAAREVDPSMGTELLLNFAISDVTSLADVDIYSVQAGAITPEMIAQVHQAGKRIYAWTVNDPRQMEVLLAMGVDGLTTDDTPAAVQAIADYEERVGQ